MTYILSGEIGLYEKYGFVKIGDYKTIYGSISFACFRSSIYEADFHRVVITQHLTDVKILPKNLPY